MDYFLEAINLKPSAPTNPTRQHPKHDFNQHQTSFQKGQHQQRRSPPPQRPTPPPMNAPPMMNPNFGRIPPPPPSHYQPPRQQQSHQQQQMPQNYQRGYNQRGRPYHQRTFRGNSAPNEQYQQFNPGRQKVDQYSYQPQRDQGYSRKQQDPYPQKRQHDFSKDDRFQRNQNQNRKFNQQTRYNPRQENQPFTKKRGRGRQQQRRPQNQQEGQYSERNQGYGQGYQKQFSQPRNQNKTRGRNQNRGRGRGRGRQQYREPQKKQKEIQKQQQSQSMEEQSRQSESQFQDEESIAQSGSYQSQENSVENEGDEEFQGSYQESRQYEQSSEGQMPQMQNQDEDDMQRIDTMVSKEEFNQRVQTFKMNNRGKQGLRLDTGRSFAIFQINKRTSQPDLSLTLKRFRRSTNRGEDDEQKDETSDHPRSKKGLALTMKHILKEIIDSDGMKARDLAFPLPSGEKKIEFLQIYDFLWNRMREMIKDVSRLDEKDRGSQQIVVICEQMLRFFIIAIREGRLPHNCKLQFDSKMNLQSITKILTQLLQIYEMAHLQAGGQAQSTYISSNQPQILGYAILISNDLQKTLNQKLRIRLSGDGLNHPLVNSKQIENALFIKKAIRNRDFQAFYNTLQSKQTDYVQTCLLIHSLPLVRRQALKVMQKTCEPGKVKKMHLSIVRKNLRYGHNIEQQFYTLLDNIEAKIIKEKDQQIVIIGNINQTLEDYKQSYAFDFGYNKTDRINYPNCKNKAQMIQSHLISREELIKRSWHTGDYLKKCSLFYDQQSEEEQSMKPSPKKKPESDPVATNSQQKKQNSLANMKLLMQKRKLLQRGKFLKSLQTLIQNLIKRSNVHSQHQRKRGISMLFESIQTFKLVIEKQAFLQIQEYSRSKKELIKTLQNICRFSKDKNKFIDSFNTDTYELSKYRTGKTYQPLSTLVNPRPKEHQNAHKQLQRTFMQNKQSKRLKILVFFISSNQYVLNSMQIKFIKNLYKFIAADIHTQRSSIQIKIQDLCNLTSDKSYLQFNKNTTQRDTSFDYYVKFYHYKLQHNNPPFLCGYDSIIYLDLYEDNLKFTKMLRQLTQSRARVQQLIIGYSPQIKTKITNLVVCSWQKFNHKILVNRTNKQEWNSRWHYIEIQSNKLSYSFRRNIIQNLISDANDLQSRIQEYEVYSLKSLIGQIYQNMQYAQGLHPNPSSIDFFEQYFKANLKYLNNVVKKMAHNYQQIDWAKTIFQAAYIPLNQQKEGVSTKQLRERININSLVSKKLTFTFEVIKQLKNIKLNQKSSSIYQKKTYYTASQVISSSVQEYLQQFQMNQRQDSLEAICQYVIENDCQLSITDNMIKGDASALVSFIFSQLKKSLHLVKIILPKGFKFHLKKTQFLKNQVRKNVSDPVPEQLQHVSSRPPLEYQYRHLLKQLAQQIKQQQTTINSYEKPPQKRIKL